MTTLNVARVYLHVSSEYQDLQRQEPIIGNARNSGCYVAAVYREKASGARSDRPDEDLQPGEVVSKARWPTMKYHNDLFPVLD